MSKRHPGRPKEPTKECKAEDCIRPAKARGLCQTHYMGLRRGLYDESGAPARPMKRVVSYGPGAQCAFEGCSRRPRALGLCTKHRQAYRRGEFRYEPPTIGHKRSEKKPKCLVPGCRRRPVNRGMCPTHAQQRAVGILDEEGNQLREPMNPGARRRPGGWRKVFQGYVLVVAPEGHPNSRSDGTILEHRLVMSTSLGRPLEDWEIIHHKDGDRSNNNFGNLQLLDGRAGKGREGHPPGSEMDYLTALQIVIQDRRTPPSLVKSARRLQRKFAEVSA